MPCAHPASHHARSFQLAEPRDKGGAGQPSTPQRLPQPTTKSQLMIKVQGSMP